MSSLLFHKKYSGNGLKHFVAQITTKNGRRIFSFAAPTPLKISILFHSILLQSIPARPYSCCFAIWYTSFIFFLIINKFFSQPENTDTGAVPSMLASFPLIPVLTSQFVGSLAIVVPDDVFRLYNWLANILIFWVCRRGMGVAIALVKWYGWLVGVVRSMRTCVQVLHVVPKTITVRLRTNKGPSSALRNMAWFASIPGVGCNLCVTSIVALSL